MRVLSIDLPWSADDRTYGFASCRFHHAASVSKVAARAVAGGQDVSAVFREYARHNGRYDLILLDQPIGGDCSPASKNFRAVEHAFTNSIHVINPTTAR